MGDSLDESAAVQSMGEDVIASCALIPNGLAWRVGVLAAGGVTGNIVGAAAAAERMRKDTAPGDHEGDLYITVGRRRVAIFKMKRGLFKKSLGELLVRFDRADLKNAEWAPGRLGPSDLNLELHDGARFELQAARVNRGRAERVYEELRAGD